VNGSSQRIPLAWLSVVIALAALRFAATFVAPDRLWGLDLLAGRGALWALFLLPFAAPLLTRRTASLGAVPARICGGGALLPVLVVVASGALFALFRSRNFLLGDSQLYVHALGEGLRIEPASVREAGATLVVSALHWALRKTAFADSETTFAAASVTAGIVYVALAFSTARLVARSPAGRGLVLASLLAGGFLQIFFGHAEYYSLVAASGMLYVLAALRWLEGKGRLFPAALALTLALAIHIMNAVLLPSFAWLLVRALRRKRYLSATAALAVVPLFLIAFSSAIDYPTGNFLAIFVKGRHMLPAGQYDSADYAYGLFESVHMRELANELLLTAPCLPLLAIAALWALGGRKRRGEETEAPEGRGSGEPAPGAEAAGSVEWEGGPAAQEDAARPREAATVRAGGSPGGAGAFLALLALGAGGFILTANPALGMARDWDIFAFPFILVSLAVSAAAAGGSLSKRRLMWLCGAVCVTGGLHLGLYVDNNRTPSAYAPRFRRIASQPELFTSIPRGELWRYLAWEAIKAGDLTQARSDLLHSIEDNPKQLKGYKMLAILDIGGQFDLLASPRSAVRRRQLDLDTE